MSEQTKPKEFYFDFKIGDNQSVSQDTTVWCIKNGKHDFHTIEKSAFDAQALEIEKLKKELEAVKAELFSQNILLRETERSRAGNFLFLQSATDDCIRLQDENAALVKAHDTQVAIAKELQKLFIQIEPEIVRLQARGDKLRSALQNVWDSRTRGYPTGKEWDEILTRVKQDLSEDG